MKWDHHSHLVGRSHDCNGQIFQIPSTYGAGVTSLLNPCRGGLLWLDSMLGCVKNIRSFSALSALGSLVAF
ncbi:hypothetical protein ACHAXS_009687 [Conticribra weissflogii]